MDTLHIHIPFATEVAPTKTHRTLWGRSYEGIT
jgi:hypothetical protein